VSLDLLNSALAHHQAGRLKEAEQLYRQIIQATPDQADAHFNLGVALAQQGQFHQAVESYRQAVVLAPDHEAAHYSLGNALRSLRRFDEAVAAYRQAIRVRPDYHQAVYNLALLLTELGRIDEALGFYRRSLELRPDFTAAYDAMIRAMNGDPRRSAQQLLSAHQQWQQGHAVDASARLADPLTNLGVTLSASGRFDEALAAFERAAALAPHNPEVHSNLGLALLTHGDFQRGWPEFEWRWKCPAFFKAHAHLKQPRWDGAPLNGRTILLHAEQGLGDAIQFVRYLPLIARQHPHAKIILGTSPKLQRLFRCIAGNAQIIVDRQAIPPFDVHCPLMSLPLIFRTTLATVPADVPYLSADASDLSKWRQRLASDSANANRLKVGLVWAGGARYTHDQMRSLPLKTLAPLGTLGHVAFYSLQKGEPCKQLADAPSNMNITDLTSDLDDFADTAALVCNLDLIISVDTAVAHLAGALAKPVWTLLPLLPDWRWMFNRDDSPWYPTMRLFRQTQPGDWPGVVSRVVRELAAILPRSSSP